jgi:hypothetical protein
VFRLSRPALLQFTVVRVYPTCKLIGRFRVRGRAGVNRVPFTGRIRGRPLAEGTYRLLVRARGANGDVAAVKIVVARGKMSTAELRRARREIACGPNEDVNADPARQLGSAAAGGDDPDGGKGSVVAPLENAIKKIAEGAKGATARLVDGRDPASSILLVTVGLLTLATAVVCGLFLLTGFLDRRYW